MTRLKLDENLGAREAVLLRNAGHDVETAFSEGLSSSTDRDLIDAASREGRALVTLDLDFSNPLIFPPAEYAGIVVIRLPPRPDAESVIEGLGTLLGRLQSLDVAGRLWVVQRGRIREYQPR